MVIKVNDNQDPWQQQPNEPEIWFARFSAWLSQPWPRSLLSIYNRERTRKGKKKALTLSGNWRRAVKRWRWRQRAGAFDMERWRRAVLKGERELLSEREKRWKRALEEVGRSGKVLLNSVLQIVKNGGGR